MAAHSHLDAGTSRPTLPNMTLKTFALAITCLLVGGIAGHNWRSTHEPAAVAPAAQTNAGYASVSAPPAATSTGTTERPASANPAAAKSTSISERIDMLLADFDYAMAGKEVDTFSPADIQAALALLAAKPKTNDITMLRSQLYRAWAVANPTAAWKAALADPHDTGYGHLLGTVATEIAKKDPSAAIDLALGLSMSGKRSTALTRIFIKWSKNDFPGVIAYLNAHPDLPMGSATLVTFEDENTFKDPAQAANLALTLKNPRTRGSAISSLVSVWAGRDPAAALKWAQSLTNPSVKKSAIEALVSSWSNNDPLAALTFAETIQDTTSRKNAMRYAWDDWFRRDPAAATAYLGKPGNDDLLRDMAYGFSSATEGFTAQERDKLLAQIPEGEAKERMYHSVSSAQIRNGQYNQALATLNTLPDSSQRDSQVKELAERWAEADLAAATAWLKLQPDSSDRDLAVAGYARSLARADPSAAAEWAGTIPDKGVREGVLKSIAVRWLTTDPVKAEAWMAGVPDFSDSTRKSLVKDAARSGDNIYFGEKVTNRR